MIHPAKIEFLQTVAELIKGLGAAVAKYAHRLKTEPMKQLPIPTDFRRPSEPVNAVSDKRIEPAKQD